MKTFFGLTSTEAEIMELFWGASKPLSFKEVMAYVTTELKKEWKKQTLNTYLSNLQKSGLLKTERSRYHYQYFAALTREEYIQQWTQKLVEEAYGNSLGNFIAAFTGGKKLSKEEAEELRKLI